MICEGACKGFGGHNGPVVAVHVIGPCGKDWGHFQYCQKAIEIDRKDGFQVEVVCEKTEVADEPKEDEG